MAIVKAVSFAEAIVRFKDAVVALIAALIAAVVIEPIEARFLGGSERYAIYWKTIEADVW